MLLTRVTPAPAETPSANEFSPGASLQQPKGSLRLLAAIVAPKLAEVFFEGGGQKRFQFSGGGKQAQDPRRFCSNQRKEESLPLSKHQGSPT